MTNLKTILLFLVVSSFLISCNKDEEEKVDELICTECSATLNGMTTTPAQFCGPEDEVKLFEQRYKDINKGSGATINCRRK